VAIIAPRGAEPALGEAAGRERDDSQAELDLVGAWPLPDGHPADSRGADLREAVLISSIVSLADRSGAQLQDAYLTDATAARTTFAGADLSRTNPPAERYLTRVAL
jgi:uncharacterized protein YjbI with pentapeptide repeats